MLLTTSCVLSPTNNTIYLPKSSAHCCALLNRHWGIVTARAPGVLHVCQCFALFYFTKHVEDWAR